MHLGARFGSITRGGRAAVMRIAVVSPYPPSPDGRARYTMLAVHALAERYRDVEVVVLATDQSSPAGQYRARENLSIIRLGRPGRGQSRLLISLVLWVLRLRPDVVHFQGGLQKEFGGIFGESLLLPLFLLKMMGYRFVVTVHNTWWKEDVQTLTRTKRLNTLFSKLFVSYYIWTHRVLYKLCSRVSIVTVGSPTKGFLDKMAQYCQTYGLGKDKVIYESHPCDLQLRPNGNQEQGGDWQRSARTVAALGFVREDKGFHVLLEAAGHLLKLFDDLRVVIAGYPARPEDEEYAARLAKMRETMEYRERVILDLRLLSELEFEQWLDEADIVVLPYLRVVAASGPLHRTLGRGKVVIASATGHNLALSDVCLLVPPGDADALAAAIRQVLENPALVDRIRARAREFAATHTWDGLAAQYYAMYLGVVDGSQK